MQLHRRRGPMHEINVVPYIDVMLVLLVIFMVTAPLVTPGIVDLPTVAKVPSAPVSPLEVMIKEDRTLVVRSRDARGASTERSVSREDLARVITEHQSRTPDAPVLIAGDRNVRYEAVLNVMDELRRQQVKRVGLLVQPGK